jgi:protein gp37
MQIELARQVRDQCVRQNVAFFFKQWGGSRPKMHGRALDNREWNEFPEHLTLKLVAAE